MGGSVGVLVVVAYLIAHLAGPLIVRVMWLRRRPTVAVAVWVGVVAGMVFVLLALAGSVLAWPPGPMHSWVEDLHSCPPGHTHEWELAALALAMLSGGVLMRGLWHGVTRASRTVAGRRRHHEMVRLVASYPEDLSDVCLVEHSVPVVYCLPRRSRPIVMTTGVLELLDPVQIGAVLEHERTHLRHRHHLLLATVDALYAALPWSATLRHARAELSRLCEMVADDAAARRYGQACVIGALSRLNLTSCPTGDLAARGEPQQRLTQRIARLEPGEVTRGPGVGAAVTLSLTPLCGVVFIAVALQLVC